MEWDDVDADVLCRELGFPGLGQALRWEKNHTRTLFLPLLPVRPHSIDNLTLYLKKDGQFWTWGEAGQYTSEGRNQNIEHS